VSVSAAAADEVIIMTTRSDTMKYKQLLTCPTVAILVHDFPHRKSDVDSEGGKTYSITLHGMARCVRSAMLLYGYFGHQLVCFSAVFSLWKQRDYSRWSNVAFVWAADWPPMCCEKPAGTPWYCWPGPPISTTVPLSYFIRCEKQGVTVPWSKQAIFL
jgi:hypothetical protein